MDIPEQPDQSGTQPVSATLKSIDVHSIVTVIGAIAVTAFIFLHPGTLGLEDIALAYLTINGGQSIGALGKGGQRWMQGGSVAPDKINPPSPNGAAS